MNRVLGTYAAVWAVLVALDLLWLGVIAKPLYQRAIGHLMAEQPQLVVGVLFYLVYAAGLTLFAVWPHAATPGGRSALVMGALFGFFAYATYDLTNLATLKGWPVGLALLDMTWGTLISGASAWAGKWVLDRLAA